jgi:predicted XRE-type DNA-binding protein
MVQSGAGDDVAGRSGAALQLRLHEPVHAPGLVSGLWTPRSTPTGPCPDEGGPGQSLSLRVTTRAGSFVRLSQNWDDHQRLHSDAGERQANVRLAYALNQVLQERKLSQGDAANVLGVTQPTVSALRHYKLAGFSVERLMS